MAMRHMIHEDGTIYSDGTTRSPTYGTCYACKGVLIVVIAVIDGIRAVRAGI